jgi:hypothetical protein
MGNLLAGPVIGNAANAAAPQIPPLLEETQIFALCK